MPTIMVIDDDKDSCSTICTQLKSFIGDCTSVMAQSGREGIDKATGNPPDVILLDVDMPDMDGYEICRRLKADSETTHIPIVMLTAGANDSQSKINALEHGADAFISKPLDSAELTAQAKAMLRIKHAEDILRSERDTLEELVNERTRQLRKSEELYRSIFRIAANLITSINTEGLIVDCNDRIKHVLGYEREEIIGQHMSKIIHPDYMEKAYPTLKKVLAEGHSFNDDYRMVRKDGQILDVVINSSGLTDSDGNYVRTICIITDLTQRKQIEEALRESEERYRVLVEGTDNFVTRVDKQGRLFYVNQASEKVFGLKAEECTGRSAFDFIHPDDRQRTIDAFNEWLSEKADNITIENRQVSTTGEVRHMLWTSKLIFDADGNVKWVDGIARDITERKQAEKEREKLLRQLQSKNDELESIVYAASHDLRSPLVNIQGFGGELLSSCRQIADAFADKRVPIDIGEKIMDVLLEDIPESLNFICTSASKMDVLLSGLLKVSRLGRNEMKTRNLDMNDLIAGITKSMEYQIRQAGVQINVEALPNCIADENQIQQVFGNLIGNAINYLDKSRPGVIDIAGRVENGRAVYCVRDNGIGIAREYHDNIFEIFHRLDPTGPVAGEGLGLTIVRRIVDRHNGKIWVESEPQKGSAFYVALATL